MDRRPMSEMDGGDVEGQQASHGYPENKGKTSKAAALCWCIIKLLISVLLIALITALAVFCFYFNAEAHYSVAIDSASALDPRAGVSFNLTIRVDASRSRGAKACIVPGTFVEVSYRGVLVAASNGAETRRTCARPRSVAELPVVARATMMPVGGVLDSLAAEMGRGAALFDLRLLVPHHPRSGKDNLLVSDCKRSRVGDDAMPCASDSYTTREYS